MTETAKIRTFKAVLVFLTLLLCGIVVFGLVRLGFGSYGEIQPDGTDIVGLWHLNDNDASEDDSSGNGNGCTISLATFTNSGYLGGGYLYNGAHQLNCGPGSGIDNIFRSTFTLMWWMYTTAQNSTCNLFDKSLKFQVDSSSNANDNIRITIDYGNSDNNAAWFNFVYVADSTWHHYAITWDGQDNTDGTHIKLYYDGVAISPVSYAGTSETQDESDASADFTIGDKHYGTMDEVVVFDRVLSASEIQQYYALQTGKYGIVN